MHLGAINYTNRVRGLTDTLLYRHKSTIHRYALTFNRNIVSVMLNQA